MPQPPQLSIRGPAGPRTRHARSLESCRILAHLASVAPLNDVAMSCLTEGLDCYVARLFKAAAVMVGGAASF
jgi:hypothetical protein